MALTIAPVARVNQPTRPLEDDINLACDERGSDSPLVERVWQSHSAGGGSFFSIAASHWEIVVSKYRRHTMLTIRGPETRATVAHCPPDAEFIGIVFRAGAFMPKFPVSAVRDRRDLNLPGAGDASFWLDSSAWEFPTFENADTFVRRLVREELLVNDPLVNLVLREQPSAVSPRTRQRRFFQATGLTYNAWCQIQRARHATLLLKNGTSILDAVAHAGYADQPHMTRALKQFTGHTPGQIATGGIDTMMSFLFKTQPF